MRLRNKNWTSEYIELNKKWVLQEEDYINCLNKFDNDYDIHLEIGCGKGNFVINKSENNEKINYIALEKERTVIGVALKKSIEYFGSFKQNLRFLNLNADKLSSFFAKKQISKIYLNFSDPWPKKRHSKYRLTNVKYLDIYFDILLKKSTIEIKTDNEGLYNFTLEEAIKSKFKLLYNNDDLYSDLKELENNTQTEYEVKFNAMGKKIKKIILLKE
ncbi:tRNA (guanine-N(7)-)-methyltransferase [Spiroplasma litorale]|uniref:tRNA (guanine-N(7)-)-methyltransferase n=1 Tax=Spiroplasma litorale TaxID=216942 RepID=A0A0K1W0A2_9MOLU|nr:tRNA (guanosine(46)-N7)-methyltransferase TrmB [Spiroplasma litorale]AKX33739.1 tRNA (guanine-N(7)-)-methyltransferase [Spiroplasma litorale]